MDWRGDEAKLAQLCQVFEAASSPDNQVQKQVLQALDQWSQALDYNMYLAAAFVGLPGQSLVGRQRAGLLLKTNVVQCKGSWTPAIAEYAQTAALRAVRDPERVIRHTAGSVLTAVVQRMGIELCLPALEALSACLTEPSNEAVEGSFSALTKICEDGVAQLKLLRNAPKEHTQPFVSWCVERLLPRVFEFASMSAPVHARRSAIECVNHFALSGLFNDHQWFVAFTAFSARYIETLGSLATDTDVAVLSEVCRGFVCVLENGWDSVTAKNCPLILQYMLQASQHPEYAVRREALEVWGPCATTTELAPLFTPILPQLVPVLLANLVYTDADFMGMSSAHFENDNAAIPDEQQDIQPRFHKRDDEAAHDEDADDADAGSSMTGGAFGSVWTARKSAAAALDELVSEHRFQNSSLLEVILPLIQQKLDAADWLVQESAVLALGAIAAGCMEGLVPYMPKIMEVLLRLAEAPTPLLRSISCWTIAQYSSWICHSSNPARAAVLPSVLKVLLQRLLDKNKKVQEAACGALATFEEESRSLMAPYMDDITQTIVHAFQLYQAGNLLVLYDVTGTMAEVLGDHLAEKPQLVEALMLPLMQKFEAMPAGDHSLLQLFECLSQLAQNVGAPAQAVVMARAPRITERCIRVVQDGSREGKLWRQDPENHERPEREVMAAAIDLLSGLATALGPRLRELLAQQNFTLVLPEALRDFNSGVRSSAFALVGDCAKECITFLGPSLAEVVPLCAAAVAEGTQASVCNNATWALGEIGLVVGSEFMVPHLDTVVPPLVRVLKRPQGRQKLLATNVCITLGRLASVCGPQMANVFGEFAQEWSTVMRAAHEDDEKASAFQGLCAVVRANPQSCIHCVPALVVAIACYNSPPPSLRSAFRDILHGYRQTLGAGWPAVLSQVPQELHPRLSQAYGVA